MTELILDTDLNNKSKGIKARINNEISHLFDQCRFVLSERNSNNTISLTIKKGKNTYDIVLPNDYPFKIPTNIRHNGRDYKKSLFIHSDKIKILLKRFYNIDCLCCNTIICGSSWMPTMNISLIINEIDKMSKIKKEIKIRLLCDEVRARYGCLFEFADFEKYLF